MKAFKTLLVTLSVTAAIAAPASSAARPDDQPGPRGPGAVEQAQPSTRPDDRAVHGAGAVATAARVDLRSPDTLDATDAGAVGTVTASTDVFDWNDALIGGLAGIGTALLATGCCLVLMSRRSSGRYA